MISVDEELLAKLGALWRIPPPGPDNLLSAPEFISLSKLIAQRTGNTATFALSNALRSLGLPCGLPAGHRVQALDLPTVADMLVKAFSRSSITRRHLCPLDLADDLPLMTFGQARVARFSAAQLYDLFDWPRLSRYFPTLTSGAERLSEFQWLVVEEEVPVRTNPEARAFPFLDMDISRDLGEIEPHRGRFPQAVEDALFFLLLAPWEDWSTLNEVDWRGFRVPWIYTLDDDLFVSPTRPPSAETLSYEPRTYTDNRGEVIEIERPIVLPLDNAATEGLQWVNDTAWKQVQAARATSLFETPVVHFLVRAFLASGIDEFIAHLTVIEAALGLESDYKRKLRPNTDPCPRLSATQRVAVRLRAAVGEGKAERDYMNLFDLRSAFIHGRSGVQCISTKQRVLARSLARRAACALVRLSRQPEVAREQVLSDLLGSPRQA
ncbi:hypothetical protein LLY24_16945 [Halomonas sp. wenzhen-202101]|uniref:Apea-like HEPN domain-containing protein n=2 Tax=Halomonas dongshanensis TaxID=2890835 RepID=A0ABT2EHG0_9GAMM|nr:hypothetical protein [Halomonas dongshanensis]